MKMIDMNNPNVKKTQEVLSKIEVHLQRMFIAGAIFAALACFGRADYNLPLYAFLYMMWDQDDVSYKHRNIETLITNYP